MSASAGTALSPKLCEPASPEALQRSTPVLLPTSSTVGSSVRARRRADDGYGVPVITAIVLIEAEVSRIPEVAAELADLVGVDEVYSVTGGVDLIAMVRVPSYEDLAPVISDRINKVAGVTGTNTHLAFRTYSKHDLEAGFDLGLDG